MPLNYIFYWKVENDFTTPIFEHSFYITFILTEHMSSVFGQIVRSHFPDDTLDGVVQYVMFSLELDPQDVIKTAST